MDFIFTKSFNYFSTLIRPQFSISVTYMSHIETGNTKLSLPVLAKIADELSVGTDALLSDAPKPDKAKLSAEVQEILDSFEADELPVAIEVLRALRDAMAKRKS